LTLDIFTQRSRQALCYDGKRLEFGSGRGDLEMDRSATDLDALIVQEKKLAALEYHNEAWADGFSEGIEAEILADAAFCTALKELIRDAGEEQALSLIESLRERILKGEFVEARPLH